MRRAPALCCTLLVTACAQRAPAPVSAPPAPAEPVVLGSDGRPVARHAGTAIEKVGFRPGVSSATVERLAKGAGCTGGVGAGLVSEPGPVEVYRMTCDDGRVYLARCELRQCKPMK